MYANLTLQQTHILDAEVKSEISWLYDILENETTHYWSHKDKTWNGNSYTFKVISKNSIKMSMADGHLVSPSETDIILSNANNALTPSDYNGAEVTVRLVMKANIGYQFAADDEFQMEDNWELDGDDEQEAEIRTFGFEVHGDPQNINQELHLHCRGWLEKYLQGEYPNTSLISDLWPSEDNDGIEDNTCVPKIFGTAFIPIQSAYITDARYYVLGPAANNYTIIKIVSPREYSSQSTWLAASYTFTQSTKAGRDGNNYDVVQFIIVDSTGNGSADSNGLFKIGEKFCDVPCQYSSDDTSSLTNLADQIEHILEDFGIPSGKIDDDSKDDCADIYDGWGVVWSGGYWYRRERKEILMELLAQGHLCLTQRDKIYFKILDKTSQLTVEKWHMKGIEKGDGSIEDTYNIDIIDPDEYRDSGYIAFQKSGRPSDKLHQILVTAKSTTNNPAKDCMNQPFQHNSQHAQAFGTLYHQRDKYRHSIHNQLFNERILQLECGDMLTVNPSDYDGGGFDCMIESMNINFDCSVDIEMIRYSVALDNFSDLSPSAITIVSDDSTSVFQRPSSGPDTPGQTGDANPNRMPGEKLVVPDGRILELIGSDTNPSIIIYKGTSYNVEIGGDVDGNRFYLSPQTDDAIDLIIGTDFLAGGDERWHEILLESSDLQTLISGSMVINYNMAKIEINGDQDDTEPSIEFGFKEKTGSNTLGLTFYWNRITLTSHKSVDLAGNAAAFDDAYADDWNNVADFPFLDDRDDLVELHKIKGSGIIDPRTGLEIIDDSTLPEWILVKNKKSGEILYDPDGKPYVSLKNFIGWLKGCIIQLDNKKKDK